MRSRTPSTRLGKALEAKREAWMQYEILEGLGRDPSRERAIAFDAYCDAREKYRSIIQGEWDLRFMKRAADRMLAGEHSSTTKHRMGKAA